MIITLALGIGANAAIFTLVRGVLIKPLVNRDEDRLVYVRQSAPGIRTENSTWSIPEIQDLKAGVKTLSEFGDFSTIAFTVLGLGEPREVNGGVVNGSYFDVMGLRPVLGRLIGPQDDGPKAPASLFSRIVSGRTCSGKILLLLGRRFSLAVLKVIAPARSSVCSTLRPVPTGDRDNRECVQQSSSSWGDNGNRAHASHDGTLRAARSRSHSRAGARGIAFCVGTIKKDHPEAYSKHADFQISARMLRDQITSERQNRAPHSARGVSIVVRGCVFQCREPCPGTHGSSRRRVGDPHRAWRKQRRATPNVDGRKRFTLWRRRCADAVVCPTVGGSAGSLRIALFGARSRSYC